MEFRNKGLSFAHKKFLSGWFESNWIIKGSKIDSDENSAQEPSIYQHMKLGFGGETSCGVHWLFEVKSAYHHKRGNIV